ncbi:MAG: ArsR/SmtB family transcription factor [Thermoplasmata archaeon]
MKMPQTVKKCIEEMGGIDNLESMLPARKILKKQANLFHSLSDKTRLRIVSILSKMPSCVCVIKEITRIADSKLSYHLALLKDADLIEGKRDKNWIIYSLTQNGRNIAESFGL